MPSVLLHEGEASSDFPLARRGIEGDFGMLFEQGLTVNEIVLAVIFEARRFMLTEKTMGVNFKIRRGVEQSGSSSGS